MFSTLIIHRNNEFLFINNAQYVLSPLHSLRIISIPHYRNTNSNLNCKKRNLRFPLMIMILYHLKQKMCLLSASKESYRATVVQERLTRSMHDPLYQ